jgi:hypothetical protein
LLPDPLPDPPPIPYEYLQRLGASIHDSPELTASVQKQILLELVSGLDEEDDAAVLDDIRHLLRALQRRSDVTYKIARDIDAHLAAEDTEETPHRETLADHDASAESAFNLAKQRDAKGDLGEAATAYQRVIPMGTVCDLDGRLRGH